MCTEPTWITLSLAWAKFTGIWMLIGIGFGVLVMAIKKADTMIKRMYWSLR